MSTLLKKKCGYHDNHIDSWSPNIYNINNISIYNDMEK
jgi:hypothetical protein